MKSPIRSSPPRTWSNTSFDGIVRCQIRHDLSFAKALPSILGQDPDIIVVGAIRDHEDRPDGRAGGAQRTPGPQTVDAERRRVEHHPAPRHGSGAVFDRRHVEGHSGAAAVRKLCENCRTEFEPSPEVLMEINLRPQDAEGKTFYYGRAATAATTPAIAAAAASLSWSRYDEVRDLISAAPTDQLRLACHRLGMTTLRESGLTTSSKEKPPIE